MPTVNVYSDEPVTINVYPAPSEEPTEPALPAGIPEVESVAALEALDPSVTMAIFRRPMRALVFAAPAEPTIPAQDTLVKHVAQRTLLMRSDPLLTWAGNGSAGPTQPAEFGFIDVGNPADFQEPTDAGWLIPAADVAAATRLPYGWAPVNIAL